MTIKDLPTKKELTRKRKIKERNWPKKVTLDMLLRGYVFEYEEYEECV